MKNFRRRKSPGLVVISAGSKTQVSRATERSASASGSPCRAARRLVPGSGSGYRRRSRVFHMNLPREGAAPYRVASGEPAAGRFLEPVEALPELTARARRTLLVHPDLFAGASSALDKSLGQLLPFRQIAGDEAEHTMRP